MLMRLFRSTPNRMGVEVRRFPSPLRDPATVSAIVGVYRQVFADAPWHEAYQCPVCRTSYGKSYLKKICDSCWQDHNHVLLVDHWPAYKVIQDFYKEVLKPNAICVLARCDEGIVGFAWGYQMEMNDEASSHLEAPHIHERLHGTYFYVDEVAVLLPYRGKGVGKNLVETLIEDQQRGRILLRTLHESPMEKLVCGMGGTIVQSISEGRVIMAM